MKPDLLKTAFLNLIKSLFPELAQRTHLPMKGRVTAVRGDAGTPNVMGGPRYHSVDIEPLNPDGTPDETRPPLKDVPLDGPFSGPQQGIYCLPAVGSIVRIAFYGGSAAHPYIDGILSDGHALPEVPENMIVLQIGGKTISVYKQSGKLVLDTDAPLVVSAPSLSAQVLSADIAGDTHFVAVVGSSVTVSGTDSRGDTFTATGTITTGSTKVKVGL